MSFLYNTEDTIAAIATPVGTGGIGVIRISGSRAKDVLSKIFSTSSEVFNTQNFEPNRVYHGWLFSSNQTDSSVLKSLIDEVIAIYFKAPKSYTGEDVAEIHCHGGINIVKNVLKTCLKAGARLAEKGEFSKRAFLNGKLDLSKAEAVLDIIHSKTDRFSISAAGNLSGNLAKHINTLRKELLDLLSIITAAIDFPEEVDEPEYFIIEEKIIFLSAEIDRILKNAESSNLMRNGLKIAFAGKPNVGKSSLFNAMLDIDRAIVTEFAGTTRDIIQEYIDIDGIPAILTDTAGIRDIDIELGTACQIEAIGINMTKNCIESADIVLFAYDLSEGMQQDDIYIYESIKHKNVIKIGTKLDLSPTPPVINDFKEVHVSAKLKTGLNELKNLIKKIVISEDISDEFCTNTRQQQCLISCKNSLSNALDACKNQEIQDLISIDLKSALISLGEITGEVVSEEIINNIFDNFCIGK